MHHIRSSDGRLLNKDDSRAIMNVWDDIHMFLQEDQTTFEVPRDSPLNYLVLILIAEWSRIRYQSKRLDSWIRKLSEDQLVDLLIAGRYMHLTSLLEVTARQWVRLLPKDPDQLCSYFSRTRVTCT